MGGSVVVLAASLAFLAATNEATATAAAVGPVASAAFAAYEEGIVADVTAATDKAAAAAPINGGNGYGLCTAFFLGLYYPAHVGLALTALVALFR